MIYTQPLFTSPLLNVGASGNTPDIDCKLFERIAVDLRMATITGTTPSVTFTVQRKDSNGNYQTLFSFTAITAVGSATKDIGPGCEVAKIPGNIIRISWVTTGTGVAATCDVSILGDADG